MRRGLLVGAAPEAPVRLPGAVGRDDVQPGGELRPVRETADVAGDLKEGILTCLFGVLPAREEAQALPQNLRADLDQQTLESGSVACGGATGELLHGKIT